MRVALRSLNAIQAVYLSRASVILLLRCALFRATLKTVSSETDTPVALPETARRSFGDGSYSTHAYFRKSVVVLAALALISFFSMAVCASNDAKTLQEALIWTGFYAGPLDGILGTGSISAIREFQTALGRTPNGQLDDDERLILHARARTIKAGIGFSYVVDDAIGAGMGLPIVLVPNKQDVEHGSNFFSNDRQLTIGVRHYNCQTTIENVYNQLKAALASSQISYDVQRPEWFAIAGSGRSKKYYFRFFKVPTGYDGMFASYAASAAVRISPAVTMLSLTFRPHLRSPAARVARAASIEQIPIAPTIAADLNVPISIGVLPKADSALAASITGREAEDSKLLFDSVEKLIKNRAGAGVKFFKYIVPKTQLSGFKSDMPVLRVVFNERVFFDTDKSDIRPEALAVLDSVASSLRDQKGAFALFVAGHTDSRGSDQYNLDLSI